MTLAKVAAGQPLKISAESFNAFVDAAAAYQASRQSRSADGGMTTAIPGIILLRNDSSTDQGRFAVLGLDDPLILPSENPQSFQERITFSGISPDEDVHANRFCILQEPIAAGGIGRAMVAGVTPMRLDIDAEEDELAAIVTDETGSLATGSEGGARILWKEPGTGAAWGIVQFPAGGAAGGSPNLVLTVMSPTTAGWSATCCGGTERPGRWPMPAWSGPPMFWAWSGAFPMRTPRCSCCGASAASTA